MDEWDQLLELANLEAETVASAASARTTWVSVAEAATAAKVSRSALRSWYRKGEVPSKMVNGPHGPARMLLLQAVMERACRSPRLQRQAKVAGVEDELASLRARVDDLERRLAELEGDA